MVHVVLLTCYSKIEHLQQGLKKATTALEVQEVDEVEEVAEAVLEVAPLFILKEVPKEKSQVNSTSLRQAR